MKMANQGLVLLSLCTVTLMVVPMVLAEKKEEIDAENYLQQFGYLKTEKGVLNENERKNKLAKSLREFQRMAGLAETGILDNTTMYKMEQPRCGVEDVGQSSFDAMDNDVRGKRQTHGRWRRTRLTYRISNVTPDMGRARVRRAINQAFGQWSLVSPLRFFETTSSSSDIVINFVRGNHDDGHPFDGKGRTLAHAFFPEDGRIHFDEDETWTDNSRGINLMVVATHELGHTLGLTHSADPSAVMAPFYSGYRNPFNLQPNDIQRIQRIYGPPTNTPTKPTTTVKPLPGDVPNPCSGHVDAMTRGPDERLYAFSGNYFWPVEARRHTSPPKPRAIASLWQGLPGNLNAAAFASKLSYFFKGDKYWVFKGFQLEPGYPKSLTAIGLPANPDAAIGMGKRMVVFKDGQYWNVYNRWHFLRVTKSYPMKNVWRNIPARLDAAMRINRRIIYFISGGQYWRFSLRQWDVPFGSKYPRNLAKQWWSC
uniref:matrix metalloproteinase-19-like n=1 Tax=Myxine glutinosa TaxID=7769 RepID=UPI00358DF5CE